MFGSAVLMFTGRKEPVEHDDAVEHDEMTNDVPPSYQSISEQSTHLVGNPVPQQLADLKLCVSCSSLHTTTQTTTLK